MSSEPITTVGATHADITRIIGAIDQVFLDEQPETLMMGLLAASILLQGPHITLEQLRDGVLKTSEYIHLYLTSLDDKENGNLELGKVN